MKKEATCCCSSTLRVLEGHEEVVPQYLLILVPLLRHTRWPKLCIVCTGKSRTWQIEFHHPAYSMVREFHVAGAASSKSLSVVHKAQGTVAVLQSRLITGHQAVVLKLLFTDLFWCINEETVHWKISKWVTDVQYNWMTANNNFTFFLGTHFGKIDKP